MEFAPEGLTKVDKKASKDNTRPAKHRCAHFRNKDHMSIYRVKTHCKSTYTVNVDLQCVNTSDEETIAPQSFRTIEPAGTDDDGEEEESRTHHPQNQTTQDQTQTRPRQDDGLQEEALPTEGQAQAAPEQDGRTKGQATQGQSAAGRPGPILSSFTVTRDLRRTEFKELLTRKDHLNELSAGTNTILTSILEELKKQT